MTNPAIFFDWNGTLLADSPLCWRATNIALSLFDVPPVTFSQYRHHWAIPIADLYKAFGCADEALATREHDLYTTWNAVYHKHAEALGLRSGARRALKLLNDQRHDVHILSNHTIDNITHHTKRLGIHHHFTSILANGEHRDNFRNNHKGARLQRFLDERGVRHGLIVGDTPEEIELARAHGLVSAIITAGQCSASRLRAAKPDFLIRSLGEIPAIAERVFGARKDVL